MYFIQQRRRDVQNWLANSRWQWVLWVERIYRAYLQEGGISFG